MTADFVVSSGSLRQASSNMSRGADEVQQILARLQAEVATLGTAWQGSASQSFGALHDDWQRGAQQVQQSMAGMAQFLLQAAATYEDAESQIARGAQR